MGNKLCSCETDFPHNENTDANLTVNYNKIQFELPKTRKGNRKEMMLVLLLVCVMKTAMELIKIFIMQCSSMVMLILLTQKQQRLMIV